MVDYEMLRLTSGITLHRHHNAGWLSLNLTRVFLKEAAVAVVAGKLELLIVIQRTCIQHEPADGVRAVQDAFHRSPLRGHVLGQVVQPPWVVAASAACANELTLCRGVHVNPPL